MTNPANPPAIPTRYPPKLTLIIGNKNYSSWSLRPWLALAAKNIPFAEILIQLGNANTRQQALTYSPTGQVPALKFGDLLLWESLAIIEYVAERHPEARLWPEDPAERAIARSLACEVHAGFAAFRAHCPMNLRRRTPRRLTPAVEEEVSRLVGYWRSFRSLAGHRGDFLFGEFSAVDAMFAPLATRIRSYQIPVDRVADEYIESIYHLPAFQKWLQSALAEPWRLEATDNIDNARPGR